MNKIKEEIKDCVIDRYLKKIIEQNKEINDIKNQLEDLTKKYINIIKLMINNKSCMSMMDNNNQSFINRYIYKKGIKLLS
jgi:5-bromo-4-chloroindolyl phosphate hydrolysis protein